MSNIQLFSFENSKINTIVQNENILFDASQICSILDFKNSRTALANHCFEEDVLKQDTPTKGGMQSKSYVNESGLYCLIFGSKKESALKFKKWVTSEVLPAIRKNGYYDANNIISNEDYLALQTQLSQLENTNKALCSVISQYEIQNIGLSLSEQAYLVKYVKIKAKSDKKAYSFIYNELYSKYNVPRYQDIPSAKYKEALRFIDNIIIPTEISKIEAVPIKQDLKQEINEFLFSTIKELRSLMRTEKIDDVAQKRHEQKIQNHILCIAALKGK